MSDKIKESLNRTRPYTVLGHDHEPKNGLYSFISILMTARVTTETPIQPPSQQSLIQPQPRPIPVKWNYGSRCPGFCQHIVGCESPYSPYSPTSCTYPPAPKQEQRAEHWAAPVHCTQCTVCSLSVQWTALTDPPPERTMTRRQWVERSPNQRTIVTTSYLPPAYSPSPSFLSPLVTAAQMSPRVWKPHTSRSI